VFADALAPAAAAAARRFDFPFRFFCRDRCFPRSSMGAQPALLLLPWLSVCEIPHG
jgi:hypothetical protein